MRQQGIRRAIRHVITYYAARGVMYLLGTVPLHLTRRVSRWLGALAFGVARRERTIAIAQLCTYTVIGSRRHIAQKLVRGVFDHLALSIVELCLLMRDPNSQLRVSIPPESKNALEEALAKQRGVIFVTGHIGNWELMAIALARAGYPIHTVARKSYDDRFTQLLSRQRSRFGVHPVYRESEGSTAKLLRVLKQGGILGMLIDQDTRVSSVFVPFFGADAHTPSGAAAFAVRTDTPVVVGTIKRTRHGFHRLNILPVSLPNDVTLATAVLTRELERRIRTQMSQWVWFHQRWKTKRLAGTEAKEAFY
ncbi:MAG: lysophospholipid acyltransferase family protein [Deltaproteobacteria bacterium]|nr:lysophospholipid acyltransferase family protein [Deltaproteobacteria bacterium]